MAVTDPNSATCRADAALPSAGGSATPRDESVTLFGVEFSKLNFEQVCDRIAERIRTRQPGFIVTPNVNHVCSCHRHPEYQTIYREAFLSLADGMPIIFAARLFGTPLPAKLSGSDMVPELCAVAAERGFSVFFLGGSPGAAEASARILKARHPALRVAGTLCPDFGFEKDPEKLEAVNAAVRAGNPDICFVALGAPKQEYWMHHHAAAMGVPVSMGVGGTFEFISGKVRRAPRILQRIGFEWLWRVAMEPRRLWRRYFVEDLVFLRILWNELRARRASTPPARG